MPRRKAPVVITPVKTQNHLQVRTQGLSLISPLKLATTRLGLVTGSPMAIKSGTDYLNADELLGRIRLARKKWASLLEPIQQPVKNMETELKALKAGIKSLDTEVDGPLLQLELAVKESMRLYKVEEARQIEAENARKAEEQRRLDKEILEKTTREASARTAQMRAKLQQARADLVQQREELAEEEPEVLAVRGESSTTRTVSKCRVVDVEQFVHAMTTYEPLAGIYRMKQPPTSLLTPEMFQAGLNRIYREQPLVVASWPGVAIEDDIIIAGR